MEGLTCCVCFEPYNMGDRRPKTLKCGHTFCRGCLLLWHIEKKRIECPNDESKYYEEVDSLPDNQAIKNMLMDLEVRCPRHGEQVVENFCTTHLALCCSLCPPHGPGCIKKNFVEDTNEITNILIKAVDDVHNGIGILPPNLKESYDRRFKQKVGLNIELLYKLRDLQMEADNLRCSVCKQIADTIFNAETCEGQCRTHAETASTAAMLSIEGRNKDEVKQMVVACISELLKNVNYCSLTLEDLDFLSKRSAAKIPELQIFGKQLIAKSKEQRADYQHLPETSLCPKCKGSIQKSSGGIFSLPCKSRLHVVCQTCANSMQSQVTVVCPLDGLTFSVKALQVLEGAQPAPPSQGTSFNPAGASMYGSQAGFPANPSGGQFQVPPELANLGVAAQQIAPGSVLRPPGLPSGLPGGPGMNPYMSPPPFMSQSYVQGAQAPLMPQMPLYQSGFAPAMPPRSGPPAGFPPMPQGPAGFAPMPQGPGYGGFPAIPQGPGFSSGMPPSSYNPGYNPLPGGPMYQSQYPAAGPQGFVANPQVFPQVPANQYSAARLPDSPVAQVVPSLNPSTPSGSGSVPCSPLPGIQVSAQVPCYLNRFTSVLPPTGLSPASMTGNNKGWHVNFQKNQVEAVTMMTFAPCVITGIGLANPIQSNSIAIVESVSLFNGQFAYGRPVAEHQGGEQLVGGNSIITYINFRTGFQIPEFTKMTLKVKIVCPPQQRVAGVDLYRGNPFERPDVWEGSDEIAWEFEETVKVGEGEFVNGQNNLSGPILRFIFRR